MAITARLCTARLHYPPELALHTATSGRVAGLDAIYLHLQRDGRTVALGEMRENIEYLTGVPADVARAALLETLENIDFARDPSDLLRELPDLTSDLPSLVGALIDCTLHDAAARRAGKPLAQYLGGTHRLAMPSNQCIFWGTMDELENRARTLVDCGYRHLKLRVAVEGFDLDLQRFERLRSICGPSIELSVDANGRWQFDEARERIDALSRFGLAAVEQPLAASQWDATAELARSVSVPIMLDEGAATLEDMDRIVDLEGLVQAHLKLVKIGGISALMEAGRRLRNAGIHFMVGQMNEGAGATAAAAHCAMVTGGEYGELYGAEGIISDPVSAIHYRDGCVHVPAGPGLGVDLDLSRVDIIWQSRY